MNEQSREVESVTTGGSVFEKNDTDKRIDAALKWIFEKYGRDGLARFFEDIQRERTLEESQRSETILAAKYSDAIAVCEQLQSELSALKGENERLKEALRLFLRNRQWMIDVGATEGPLPQSLIENFAELQSEAVDSAKAALAKGELE